MSLLESSSPAHRPALRNFATRLRKGGEADRALLQNLQDEDRVPDAVLNNFHDALVKSRRRSWRLRFSEAAPIAERAVPVPTPRPAVIAGAWWNHVELSKLIRFSYISSALHRGSRPPPRLPLRRLIGLPEDGRDRSLWITPATSASADDIRNRLGLCYVDRGACLYRVRIGIDAAPTRPLYIPTAIDAGFYPAWRHPGCGHSEACGLTRHLETDEPCERELLTLPHSADALEALYVGEVQTAPPRAYLRLRGIV